MLRWNLARELQIRSGAFDRIDLFAVAFPALEFVEEGAAADAEGAGGFGTVVVMFFQGAEDDLFFLVLQFFTGGGDGR